MALESLGNITARQIDLAFKLCHDMILNEGFEVAQENLKMCSKGLWSVYASKLDGEDAVEIRIAVG
jgi:hypothetical protein